MRSSACPVVPAGGLSDSRSGFAAASGNRTGIGRSCVKEAGIYQVRERPCIRDKLGQNEAGFETAKS